MFRKDSDLRRTDEEKPKPESKIDKAFWLILGGTLGNMICFVGFPNLQTLDFVFASNCGLSVLVLVYAASK